VVIRGLGVCLGKCVNSMLRFATLRELNADDTDWTDEG